jgi:hypothetical protein
MPQTNSKRTDTKRVVPDRPARLNPHDASPPAAQPHFSLTVVKIRTITQSFAFREDPAGIRSTIFIRGPLLTADTHINAASTSSNVAKPVNPT